ncbi:GGDEF domain-containing protein [Roseobacter weihaiensis]|uniref:GGDEF domain-containing protein n=1 Tax=Roseobacter weihaiensis TaxID=2763262 RepID=UPI001D0B9B04|nr:GGDEF domain-containing protein [Roseobacter sp. H9]
MSQTPCREMLDVLCPMHMTLDESGYITAAGPTARKICPEGLVGQSFLEMFEIKRPREIKTITMLCDNMGTKLTLRFRAAPRRQLKGVVMAGPGVGEMVVNLSFGISILEAVQEYDLTATDFAATDLTVEMLYLMEAKSAAMDASRQLNQRLQTARVQAEELALTDTLTGLRNRRAIDHALASLLSIQEPFALMHADLDYFKKVNDTLGHAMGDYVLQRVAKIMLEAVRKDDVVGRIGGDEFLILIRGSENRAILDRIAQRIIERLQVPIHLGDKVCEISGSIGIVLAGSYSKPTADQMLGDADVALYAAKNAGRGRHILFAPEMRRAPKIA